jgi:hypothetical protein
MWFYWIGVVRNLQFFLLIVGIIGGILAASGTCIWISDSCVDLSNMEPGEKKLLHKLLAVCIACVLMVVACLFIPSEETIYKMMIAKQVTVENVAIAKDVVQSTFDYIMEAVKGIAEAGK